MPSPAEATSGPADAVADGSRAPAGGFTIVGHDFGDTTNAAGEVVKASPNDDHECLGCSQTWAEIKAAAETADSLCPAWIDGRPDDEVAAAFREAIGRDPARPAS